MHQLPLIVALLAALSLAGLVVMFMKHLSASKAAVAASGASVFVVVLSVLLVNG